MVHRERGHREIIRSDTREALAAYFAGERLYEYIYPFSRIENPEKLNWRRFQTVKHYRNYPKEIGRKYLEGLFRGHPITRQFKDQEFDAYLGSRYDAWFRRDIAMPCLYLPELFVVISMPDDDSIAPASLLEQDMRGLKPYPVIVYPQHVRDYEMDSDGNILWITFDAGAVDGHAVIHCYTPDEFITANVIQNDDTSATITINPQSRAKHGFSRCPVVRIAYEDNASYADVGITAPVGHAMMKEIVSLSIAALQFHSMYIEACYSHLYYKMIMGSDTAAESLMSGLGNDSVIVESPEEKGQTRYMPTPSFEIQALRQTVFQEMPAQIYQQARLRDHSVAIAQSGLAKTFDMVPETGVLSAIAEFLSEADHRIVDMLAEAWMGPKYDASKVSVTYPATFDVRTPLESIQDFIQFTGAAMASPLPISKTAIREMVKGAQRGLLPAADSDLLQLIDEETDIAPFAPTTDVIQPGQTGVNGQQMPFQQFSPQPPMSGDDSANPSGVASTTNT